MSTETQQPSPERFFQIANSYQLAAALRAAVELDLFTAVAEGKRDPRALAARCGASERGARILSDFLVVAGLLTKDDGGYGLTQDSAVFLDRRSPAYMGGTLEFLHAPSLVAGFEDLAGAVRKGGTMIPSGGTVATENPLWVKFARAMAPMAALPADAIAKLFDTRGPVKVLDIAAGHGLYGIAFARQNHQVEVVALDWPGVLEVAKENARSAGVAGRYSTIEGDAFNADFGTGYNLVLLTNFLHHFDPQTCVELLSKVRAALTGTGECAVLTLEFVPDEDRVSPPVSAAFSLTMLAGTEGGDAYTFPELERMFAEAGFSRSEPHQLTASPQKIIISRK